MSTSGWRKPETGFLVLGHLLFLGLSALALIHFRERTVHVDSALQTFKWVQAQGVEVEAHRYTAIVPQLLVKLFKAWGADLAMLLTVASLAHVLVPWAVFAWVAHVWRTPWVAAAAALAAVLCTRLTFYGIVLEANYLLSYPFLLAGALQGPVLRRRDRAGLLMAFAALLPALLVHPLGGPVLLFVLAFFFLAEHRIRGPVLVLALPVVLWSALGRLLLPPTGYERGLYRSAVHGAEGVVSGASSAFDFLQRHTWPDSALYLGAWLALAAALVLMLRRRAFLLAVLTTAAVLVFVTVTAATYRTGETAMMMEKNFLPLAVLIALPLMHEVGRMSAYARLLAWLPCALLLFAAFRTVSFASRPAGERLAAIEGLVRDARASGVRKAVITDAEARRRGLGVTWALPFEALLASALEGPKEAVVVAVSADAGRYEAVQGVLLDPWRGEVAVAELDRRYFVLPTGPYAPLQTLPGR